MNLSKLSALSALLLASSAVGQLITLPAPTSVYNGYSRGFAFTAPNQFLITGLDLPTYAQQAGDTANYIIFINQVEVFRSLGNAGAITLTQMVQPGDWVDVIGNWSPATTNNFSAHNAYTAGGGTYSTAINGVATTLYRSGFQWDISDPGYTGGSLTYAPGSIYGFPGTGSMGVVNCTTTPATGLFANFTSDVTGGASPLTVNFQDTSFSSDPGGVTGWAWDFENDGTVDSTAQNPTHIYTACGTYDVSLMVTDGAFPPDTKVVTAYIVTDVVSANFTDGLIGPGVVQFTDTSTNSPTSWSWDLDGDGTADSTAQNPAWVYATTAPVAVTLTAQRLCGPADTITRTIVPLQQISTGYAQNNGNGNYGSILFDLDVLNPAGMKIESLDVFTTTVSLPVQLDMYIRQGTYSGYENTASEWVLAGSATGTSSTGNTVPTSLTFGSPVYLPPGVTGVKFHYMNFYCSYTTGTAVQTFGNADVAMTAGTSQYTTQLDPFAGTTLTPRWFAGTIYYSTQNLTGEAGYGQFGAGCAGTIGRSSLTPSANPVLGTTLTVTVDNLASNAAIMVTGFSKTAWALGALPYDLTSFGASGCALRVSPDSNLFILGASNSATWSLGIPNAGSLSGLLMFQQAIALDPTANGAGAVGSNSAAMLIGL
ncbi:MAG: PKD domain-containing protein [Planctomycetes bacterium]|nr:PKD domain-containing protein [Planctomycetota bacterium]